MKNRKNSSFSSNHPGAFHPILQIVLMQFILFFKSSSYTLHNRQRSKELNKLCPPNSSDNCCLCFFLSLFFFYGCNYYSVADQGSGHQGLVFLLLYFDGNHWVICRPCEEDRPPPLPAPNLGRAIYSSGRNSDHHTSLTTTLYRATRPPRLPWTTTLPTRPLHLPQSCHQKVKESHKLKNVCLSFFKSFTFNGQCHEIFDTYFWLKRL